MVQFYNAKTGTAGGYNMSISGAPRLLGPLRESLVASAWFIDSVTGGQPLVRARKEGPAEWFLPEGVRGSAEEVAHGSLVVAHAAAVAAEPKRR